MQPGETIEQYVLIEQIGQGGQAAVWSAEDGVLRRTVAIKTINLTTPIQPNTLAGSAPSGSIPSVAEQASRFRTEAEIIADLEHPYILPIYTFGQKGDWLYIVMRYMPGGTLRTRIAAQGMTGMTLQDMLKIATPLADALDQAHSKHIIHRDIKSVNILMDAQGRPYLADFGLSVTAGDPDSSRSGSGTLAYMAPEQLRGDGFDHRADLYAFGILLYEMMTGSVPSVGTMHWNLSQMMNGTALPDTASIPTAVMEVLRRATAIDPTDRFETATALVEALKEGIDRRNVPRDSTIISTFASVDDVLFLEPIQLDEGSTDTFSLFGGDNLILIDLNDDDPAAQAGRDAMNMVEAALTRWSDGAGRFRFYDEDFRFAELYYDAQYEAQSAANDASPHDNGTLLDSGIRRLMLRAALEHDYHIERWWDRTETTADRRAVALQTLTSELPLARLRALEKLSTVQDSTPPAIPTRAATILQHETEPAVRLAGVKLLHARADEANTWGGAASNAIVDSAVGSAVDSALIQFAVDSDPLVRAEAAATIAKARSTAAVTGLVRHLNGDPNMQPAARSSLIAIRDQVGSLPSSMAGGTRRMIFTALSIRQLFAHGVIGQYIAALLGFGVGWAVVQYVQFGELTGAGSVAASQAIGNAVASAALYGALVAVALTAAILPAERLRAWNVVARTLLGWILGTGLAVVAFLAIRNYYYFASDPLMETEWPLLIGVCALFTGGFALGSGVPFIRNQIVLRGLIGGLGAFAALAISHQLYLDVQTNYALLVAFSEQSAAQLAAIMAVSLGILTYLPAWRVTLNQWIARASGFSAD